MLLYMACVLKIPVDPVNGEIRIIGETDAEDDFLKNEISILQGAGEKQQSFHSRQRNIYGFLLSFMLREDMKRQKRSETTAVIGLSRHITISEIC